MTGFNHGLTGAVIAITIKQPLLALPLSFLSHYLTDMIPHLGFKQSEVLGRKFNQFIRLDFCISILMMILLAILFPEQIVLVWSCMIIAAAPDIVWWLYRKSVKDWPRGLGKFTKFHFHLNSRSHISHFYFDALWFLVMWTIILTIRF